MLLATADSTSAQSAVGALDRDAGAITVSDLISYSTIGDPRSLDWDENTSAPGIRSPDGKRWAVVIRNGNVRSQTNDARLIVYETSSLMSDATPRTVATFSSATNAQPIAYVRWLSDSESLVFAATDGAGFSQIYRANSRNADVTQLTQKAEQLLWYDITPSGEWLATVSTPPGRRVSDDPSCKARGCLISASILYDAERRTRHRATTMSVHDLRSNRSSQLPNLEDTDSRIDFCDPELAGGISPDGKFALRRCRLKAEHLPSWWGDYAVDANLKACAETKNPRCFRIAVLFDLQNGQILPLTVSPMMPPSNAAPLWIDEGRFVIIPGALESLQGTGRSVRDSRAKSYAVTLLNPRTRSATQIARLDPSASRVVAARWDPLRQLLTVDTQRGDRSALPSKNIQRINDKWIEVAAAPATRDPTGANNISLVIQQSLNDRPVLIASDSSTGQRHRVLDPNPWLADKQLGRVEPISWETKDKRGGRGGIIYPPNYSPGKRYPLVMQTHGFRAGSFSLHGVARNFPGQALAARGFVVLQVAENEKGIWATPAVWEAVQSGYEGAIEHLDRLAVIDRARVGIQGWSSTGAQIGYTLTHSTFPFAAAVFSETADVGWWMYLAQGTPKNFDAYFGSAPVGEGLNSWFRDAPTFNLDRVRTPMLMWGREAWQLWDWYAGLRRFENPVEYWVLPDATHEVFQVGHCLATNELIVDWFRFWLKGEQDDTPEKAEQYRRWRSYRLQTKSIASESRDSSGGVFGANGSAQGSQAER
jgi:dipeptidyl aminopeptidase/acylaminoacyl peptidase